MPLTEDIVKEIDSLSEKGKQDELVKYLTERLNDNSASPEYVFEYAENNFWENKAQKTYAVSADSINSLGLSVGKLASKDQQKLKVKFYKLAADRGSEWGNRNYAFVLLDKTDGSEKKALPHIKRAIELANATTKAGHKLVLCQALRIHDDWQPANVALIEYFQYRFGIYQKSKTQKDEEPLKEVLKLLTKILGEFKADFEPDTDTNKLTITDERCSSNLEELNVILSCTIKWPPFLAILQEFYYIQGQCYEALGNYSNAWLAYCKISDEEALIYPDAIAARIRLLKQQIRKLLNFDVSTPEPMVGMEIDEDQSIDTDLLLPSSIPLRAKFNKKWKHENEWFDSVDVTSLDDEFKKRKDELEVMINAKNVEVSYVDELFKEDADKWLQKAKALKAELEMLENVMEKFEEKYKQHTALYRKRFRRHQTESRFFEPGRSTKKEKLAKLVEVIIDQRFKLKDDGLVPINLAGISGRLLITAERVFQEAVIKLSGQSTPVLGIPIRRKKPWTIDGYEQRSGFTTYGPVEHYQIGTTVVHAEHRVEPKPQRLGDSFMTQLGNYNDFYKLTAYLTGEDIVKERELASLMLHYGKCHETVALDQLQKIQIQATQENLEEFNCFCFLIMTKEQSQWHSATNESFQLGMTVSLARCLIMIEAGFIRFSEAFKNTVLFSIYSHTGLANSCAEVSKSAIYIDKMYLAYLQQKRGSDHVAFFRKYVKKEVVPECVLTRRQAHQDMLDVYGGNSDTDGEGYESDLSM